MILNKFYHFFTKTVRRQLIWGVVLVHAVLMMLFVWDTTKRQQNLLLDQQITHASALVHSVSTSSAGWLLSRDVIGLQEIIDAQIRYPELLFAMAIDQTGLILAHTDRERRGQYIIDLPVKAESVILSKTSELVDIISPAIVDTEHVGWIRIGIGQRTSKQQLTKITQNGIIYASAAILIGIVLAGLIGTRLTRRLSIIQSVANEIESGKVTGIRAPDKGTDEAAQLAKQFNKMLDTLDKRKQELISTHEALQTSEARYARSLRGANDGLWEWNLQTNELYFSPRWKNMLGYEDDELESNFSTWECLTFPDDVKKTTDLIQQYLDGSTEKFEAEFRMKHKQGHWLHILSRGEVERDEEGKPLLLSGTHVDITARINAENRLQQLAENLNEVVWLGSPDRKEIYYISPAFEKIWGIKVDDIYRNPSLWIEAVHPDDRQQVLDDITKDIHNVEDYIEFRKYRIQKPDGKIIWINSRAYPIRDEDGKLIRIAGIAEDITEHVTMEETVRRTQKMDALGKLTGGIAHDFNNLLGVILGYAELLNSNFNDNPKVNRYIEEIITAGNRATKLTSKLLAFSRVQPTDEQSTNINQLLEQYRDMLEKTLTAKINLMIESSDDLWDVCIDKELLGDSILNMCINSMHAMPQGGSLTLSTENVHLSDSSATSLSIQAGDYVKLSVIDNGSGISNDIKERVFEPFFTTKGSDGTGLGMSQVYSFVKQSNGQIEIQSEPAIGTKISIFIPRQQNLNNVKDNEDISIKSSEIKSTKDGTILVVDDESALRELAVDLLSSKGYKVLSAEDGVEALKVLSKNDVDLLLTDVIMPNMDGFELAEQVTKLYPTIKIMIASGYNDTFNDKASQNDLYLKVEKPYELSFLLNKIRELLS